MVKNASSMMGSSDPMEGARELGRYLIEVDMFPAFFISHFCIACLMIREDSKLLGPKFAQNHPLASWVSSILTGLAGVFVVNFLFGQPVIDIMKEDKLILILTAIWYLMNFCPLDVFHKLVRLPLVYLVMAMFQEGLRARCIYLGLHQAEKVYPGAIVIALLAGVVNGNGYGYIKIVEGFIRGKWTPNTNDFLEVTYFAKSSLYASGAFLLQRWGVLSAPVELVYLAVVSVFMALRVVITLTPHKDPLLPLEAPLCRLLFGSGEVRGHGPAAPHGKMENGKAESKKRQ